ncbi:hypothetical protein ACFQZE_13580 [Paenibacillus sp. GCM10027627]|uniref:hypothetical protein n=1 Tax=unclassified Paenibacillus TaxID=185978 RepID=UPI00363651C2
MKNRNVRMVRIYSIAYQTLVTLMRILFGFGWFMAGLTKITGKAGETSWFQHPGEFLTQYLSASLMKPQVPHFYKIFIEHFCLDWVMSFNYIIPIVQMTVGILLILGVWILPLVLITMFMHINFILSGNMNLLSLTLYTSAFGILMNLKKAHTISVPRLISRLMRNKGDKSKASSVLPDHPVLSPQKVAEL